MSRLQVSFVGYVRNEFCAYVHIVLCLLTSQNFIILQLSYRLNYSSCLPVCLSVCLSIVYGLSTLKQRWKTEWSFDGKLCQEYSYQKLPKSDNWFSSYSQKCRGCFLRHSVHCGPQKHATFYMRKELLLSAHLSHRNSVCLSVYLSHGWISQKRCKLGSPNLHRRLPGRL